MEVDVEDRNIISSLIASKRVTGNASILGQKSTEFERPDVFEIEDESSDEWEINNSSKKHKPSFGGVNQTRKFEGFVSPLAGLNQNESNSKHRNQESRRIILSSGNVNVLFFDTF